MRVIKVNSLPFKKKKIKAPSVEYTWATSRGFLSLSPLASFSLEFNHFLHFFQQTALATPLLPASSPSSRPSLFPKSSSLSLLCSLSLSLSLFLSSALMAVVIRSRPPGHRRQAHTIAGRPEHSKEAGSSLVHHETPSFAVVIAPGEGHGS